MGPGDEVTATLVVPDSRYWIEDLVVVKKGDGVADASRAPARRSRAAPVPDVALVDQDGRRFRLPR